MRSGLEDFQCADSGVRGLGFRVAGWHVGSSLFVSDPLEMGRSLWAATVDTKVRNDPKYLVRPELCLIIMGILRSRRTFSINSINPKLTLNPKP